VEDYSISLQKCIEEKEELSSRLMEAYEVIDAIRSETVDGIVFDVGILPLASFLLVERMRLIEFSCKR